MSKFEEQTFKTCKRCNRLLPVDNFYINIRYNRLNKKGEPIKYYYSYCKDCMKITSRVNKGKRVYKYNIEANEAIKLLKVCEVYGSSENLCIDHRHSDNQIRGVLCRECNLALGLLKDNPNRIESLLRYLNKSL